MQTSDERQAARERRHRTHVGKVGYEDAYEALCVCGWRSRQTYATDAQAAAVGQEHTALATAEEAQAELEAEQERRSEWDKPEHVIACPNCGSEDVQEVGCVTYWCRTTLLASAEGVEFDADGSTEYADECRPAYVECRDCMHIVCELGADAHEETPRALERRVDEALRKLREDAEARRARAIGKSAGDAAERRHAIERVCDAWDALRQERERSR